MKRFMGFAVGLAVLASAAPAAAQDMPMRFGIIGGVNFASVSGDDFEDVDMRTGFDVGVLAQIPLGMVLTFQPEVHYSQKGATGEEGTAEVEYKLNYVDIPLMLRMGMPLAEGLDVDLLVGPYIGVNIGCELEGEDGGVTATAECEDFDAEPATDFGLVAGAGFSWAMGAGDLMIDGRYQWGFTDLVDETDGKNRNIQVLVGYAFPFGM